MAIYTIIHRQIGDAVFHRNFTFIIQYHSMLDMVVGRIKMRIMSFEMVFHELIPTAKSGNMPCLLKTLNQLKQIRLMLHVYRVVF